MKSQDHTLPPWNWADLELVLSEIVEDAPHSTGLMHIMHGTREQAASLSATELLKEVLMLGALAHSRTGFVSPLSLHAVSCSGSA